MTPRARRGRRRSDGRAAGAAAAAAESPSGGAATPWPHAGAGPARGARGEEAVDSASLPEGGRDAGDLPTPNLPPRGLALGGGVLRRQHMSCRALVAREWVRRCFSSAVDCQLALLCRSPRSRGSFSAGEADADSAVDSSLDTSATSA
ncbi:unnamed protein product [Prorocentrum cordatum]|uniref:Uncharacterized protein n=1 Tax=Prorocentrum cordatum TaxID=2364126 RepID=A0ABN9TDW6_9DINO|nr:unnamed protein product [Polarella glacialis]